MEYPAKIIEMKAQSDLKKFAKLNNYSAFSYSPYAFLKHLSKKFKYSEYELLKAFHENKIRIYAI